MSPFHRVRSLGFPLVALLAIGYALPLTLSVAISLTDLDASGLRQGSDVSFEGLQNFQRALGPDSPLARELWTSVRQTGAFALGSTLGLLGLGWIGALLLPTTSSSGERGVKALLLLPWAMPAIAAILGWRLMLLHDGIVNDVLMTFGLIPQPVQWLLGPNALGSMVVVNVWSYFPFFVLVLEAGLRAVPRIWYEAARLDGAGPWSQFRHITWPAMRGLTVRMGLLSLLWSVLNFHLPYTLFGASAPESATTLPLLIYLHAFQRWQFGSGAALSLMLFIVELVLALSLIRVLLRREPIMRDAHG